MAHRRMMEHTRWLVVFVLVFVYRFRSGLCDISLTMEKTVMGYKRESVVIPCTYTASNNEDVIKIEWEFESHLVIYRADEQDHIPLFKYRNRAVISKLPSGDVSLTLRRLDIDDRGNFKCKVTGRESNGKLITQEDVTILKVLRKKTETADVDSEENDFWTIRPPTEQPKVTTAENKVTTKVLITTKTDMRVSTAGEETFTEDNVSSSDEHEEIITTKIPRVVTEHIVTESPKMESETTAWWDNTRTFITVNSDVKVSSVGEEPELTTENIVTETPHMETEQTTWQDVKTRIFITVIPDVKVSSVGKEPDLTTENPISNIDDHDKKITPTKNSQTVTEYIVTETPYTETETTAWWDLNPNTKNPVTDNPDMECEITAQQSDSSSNILINGASSEDDSAIARTKQPRKFHSSTFPAYSFTTHFVHNNPPAEAIKSSGIFFYVLIIGLLCIVLVLIVTIVLFARKRKRKNFSYNLPTMNQLALNLEGRSHEPVSNNYEPDFPVSQYDSLPMCSHVYEQLVLKNPEGNDSQCQSSQ